MKNKGLKTQIIDLRISGKSYKKIADELGCSKSLISYYCKQENLTDIGLRPAIKADDRAILGVYKNNTAEVVCKLFDITLSQLNRVAKTNKFKKRKKLTTAEAKLQNYNRVKSYRQKQKQRAVDYKGKKCEICGYDKCITALEFHHKDPNKKDFGLSTTINKSWNKLKPELDKCMLVCANCHREIHYIELSSNGEDATLIR